LLPAALLLGIIFSPEAGGEKFLRNVLVQNPPRQYFTEYNEISTFFAMIISTYGDILGSHTVRDANVSEKYYVHF
jgi:hypothetical protein